MKDVILEKRFLKDKKIDNNPKNIPLNATLSLRTIKFTNRYELLAHQPNTSYGFSATLFEDKGEFDKSTGERKAIPKDSKYILVFRGTEIGADDLSIDIVLATNGIPMQCYELARFYEEQIKKHLDYKQKLIIVGHSLGGF